MLFEFPCQEGVCILELGQYHVSPYRYIGLSLLQCIDVLPGKYPRLQRALYVGPLKGIMAVIAQQCLHATHGSASPVRGL